MGGGVDPLGMSAAAEVRQRQGLTRLELALLLAAVVICRVCALRAVPLYDDAFITYRYARNLAEGAGLVFNPGEAWEPVLGTTTPAYSVLLALCGKLGADIIAASLSINILCEVGSAWLIARGFGLRRATSAVALLAFALLPHLVRIGMGGMEAPLFCLLALAAASAFARSRFAWAGLFAGLTCTVRPEGVLLVGVLALFSLGSPRQLLRVCVPIALVGLATVGLLELFYGDFVPQSVHAKAHMHSAAVGAELWQRWQTILMQSFSPSVAYLPVLPLVALGMLCVLRRPGAPRLFTAFALAITASYLAARPHVWGWYFYVPLVAWCIGLGAGFERALEWFQARRPALPRWARSSVPLVLAIVCGTLCFGLATSIAPTPIPEKVYAPMQRWARATSKLHPHARILAADIGAIGWAWSGTVLDSEGLTWPQAFLYAHPNEMIEKERPEYVLLVAERPRVAHFYDAPPAVRAQYVAIARFSAEGETELEPKLESLSPVWRQEYLLYKRVDM